MILNNHPIWCQKESGIIQKYSHILEWNLPWLELKQKSYIKCTYNISMDQKYYYVIPLILSFLRAACYFVCFISWNYKANFFWNFLDYKSPNSIKTVQKQHKDSDCVVLVVKMVSDVGTEVQLSITCWFQNNTSHFNINIHSHTFKATGFMKSLLL